MLVCGSCDWKVPYYPWIHLSYNSTIFHTIWNDITKIIIKIFFTSFSKIFVKNFLIIGWMGTSDRSLKYVHTSIRTYGRSYIACGDICSSIYSLHSIQWSPLPLLLLPSWWYHRQMPLPHPHLSLELPVTRKYPGFTEPRPVYSLLVELLWNLCLLPYEDRQLIEDGINTLNMTLWYTTI